MKLLLLLLPLVTSLASDPVTSNKIQIHKTDSELVTVQSIREDDEYLLRIEITSPTWQVGHAPCELVITIESSPVGLPCSVRSEAIISPRHADRIVEYVTVTQDVSRVLRAESANIRVGPYELDVTKDQWRQLRTVLKPSGR